jgi:hypothetical protein
VLKLTLSKRKLKKEKLVINLPKKIKINHLVFNESRRGNYYTSGRNILLEILPCPHSKNANRAFQAFFVKRYSKCGRLDVSVYASSPEKCICKLSEILKDMMVNLPRE